MRNLADISETIDECAHRDLELKTDIDEILDILNEIKERQKDNGVPSWLKKDTEELRVRYNVLLKKYSCLLKDNEETSNRAEELKSKLLNC